MSEAALEALERGDREALARLLDDRPELLGERLAEGGGLVWHAARILTSEQSIPLRAGGADQEAALALLLERGADPELADASGWTALHCACMSGHLSLVRSLLQAGASVRSAFEGHPDRTPVCWAMFYAHDRVAEAVAEVELVPGGLRAEAALGRPLAHWFDEAGELREGAAAGRGFYRPLPAFPEWDAPADRQTLLDESLTWAARNGRLGALEELVERGAGLDSNAYRGTALLWATYAGRLDAIRWLLERGADPNHAHDFGGAGHGFGATALHLAGQFGALDTIRLLVELGADLQARDALHSGTPEEWAAHCGQPEAADLLRGLA